METATPPSVSHPSDVLPAAAEHVYTLFKEHLPETIVFHTYRHTVDVADTAAKIARKSDLDERTQALVTLAAWFHDAGFTETYEGHEPASARIARAYLDEQGLPEDDLATVERLILATRPDHAPDDLAERVLRDADIAHIGKRKFDYYSARLRQEWEAHRGEKLSDREWLERQSAFVATHDFATAYAKDKYGSRRRKNLRTLRRDLAAALDDEKGRVTPSEETVPKRGRETLFRSTYRTHINLSAIADSKANIMISINAILMSIIVSFVSTRFSSQDVVELWLLVPAGTLLVFCLGAVIFAILSARPKVTSTVFTLEDVRQNRSNLLFFGNFANMTLDTFNVGMREIIEDYDMLYDSMIHDLYGLGLVLQKKYRMLWISYTVFMVGLSVSVILFLILFVFLP